MEFITLEIEGRRHELVAGLVWHPLHGTGAARTRAIQAFARQADADLKVLRGDDPAHVGLARSGDGARAGQVAAAAVIADALAQEGHRNALAALRLPGTPGQLLYLAMRDGVILADGDSVGPEAEVRRRLTEDRAYGGWDQVVCPPEWDLPDAAHRHLESFFPAQLLKQSKCWQLQELRLNLARLALLAVLLAVVPIAGTWAWRSHREQQQVAEALVLAQQREAQRATAESARRGVLPVPPWPRMPRSMDFAQACVAALARAGWVAGNWTFDGGVCEQGQLTLRWRKANQAAWASHLVALRPHAVIAADGLSALESIAATAPIPAVASEPLQDLRSQRLRYFDLASRYGMTIRVDPAQAPAAPTALPGQTPAAMPQPAGWAEALVQVTVALDPLEAARLLQAPGLRWRRLAFTRDRDGIPYYQFSGVHYVLP